MNPHIGRDHAARDYLGSTLVADALVRLAMPACIDTTVLTDKQ